MKPDILIQRLKEQGYFSDALSDQDPLDYLPKTFWDSLHVAPDELAKLKSVIYRFAGQPEEKLKAFLDAFAKTFA